MNINNIVLSNRDADGKAELTVYADNIEDGTNIALVSPSGAYDSGYALEGIAENGSQASAIVRIPEGGSWQARLIANGHPGNYFQFTASA